MFCVLFESDQHFLEEKNEGILKQIFLRNAKNCFSDNFLQDNRIIFQRSADNFELAHKTHAKFQFGVQIPLK